MSVSSKSRILKDNAKSVTRRKVKSGGGRRKLINQTKEVEYTSFFLRLTIFLGSKNYFSKVTNEEMDSNNED